MVQFEPENAKNLPDNSFLLKGKHRAVVLFDSTFPRKTVIVVPISSLYDNAGNKKFMISTDVEMLELEYTAAGAPHSGLISNDSFIMTNQIHSVSRTRLEDLKGDILPKDMTKLDLQLIQTIGLQNTITALIDIEVEECVKAELEARGIALDDVELVD